MAALTANEVSIVAKDEPSSVRYDLPVDAGVNCFQGAMIGMLAGVAAPMVTATGIVAVGRCRVQADNSTGADGDLNVAVDTGVFGPYVNDGASIAASDIGSLCYAVDDQTVNLADGGTRSVAGSIVEVTSAGVFVAFTFPKAPLGT